MSTKGQNHQGLQKLDLRCVDMLFYHMDNEYDKFHGIWIDIRGNRNFCKKKKKKKINEKYVEIV